MPGEGGFDGGQPPIEINQSTRVAEIVKRLQPGELDKPSEVNGKEVKAQLETNGGYYVAPKGLRARLNLVTDGNGGRAFENSIGLLGSFTITIPEGTELVVTKSERTPAATNKVTFGPDSDERRRALTEVALTDEEIEADDDYLDSLDDTPLPIPNVERHREIAAEEEKQRAKATQMFLEASDLNEYLPGKLKEALEAYNATHPDRPIDESGYQYDPTNISEIKLDVSSTTPLPATPYLTH